VTEKGVFLVEIRFARSEDATGYAEYDPQAGTKTIGGFIRMFIYKR